MRKLSFQKKILMIIAFGMIYLMLSSLAGADIELEPLPGGAVVIKDGVNDRLLIYRDGRVQIPGLVGAAQQDKLLCFDAVSGELGGCPANAGQGPQGPQGPQGDAGLKGIKGLQGNAGNDGIGPQGAPGDPGVDSTDPGPQGPEGPVGPQVIGTENSAACNLGNEGAIRWNDLSSKLEFCDGVDWNEIELTDQIGPTPVQVFVTSSTHTGDLGGITGADSICQNLADAANLMGSFKAWLSDSNTSPADSFTQNDGDYILTDTDGTVIATDWANLTDGNLAIESTGIRYDETGTELQGDAGFVWTGTFEDGTTDGTQNCDDWNSDSAAIEGRIGDPSDIGSAWSFLDIPGGQADRFCSNTWRLYCFEQIVAP